MAAPRRQCQPVRVHTSRLCPRHGPNQQRTLGLPVPCPPITLVMKGDPSMCTASSTGLPQTSTAPHRNVSCSGALRNSLTLDQHSRQDRGRATPPLQSLPQPPSGSMAATPLIGIIRSCQPQLPNSLPRPHASPPLAPAAPVAVLLPAPLPLPVPIPLPVAPPVSFPLPAAVPVPVPLPVGIPVPPPVISPIPPPLPVPFPIPVLIPPPVPVPVPLPFTAPIPLPVPPTVIMTSTIQPPVPVPVPLPVPAPIPVTLRLRPAPRRSSGGVLPRSAPVPVSVPAPPVPAVSWPLALRRPSPPAASASVAPVAITVTGLTAHWAVPVSLRPRVGSGRQVAILIHIRGKASRISAHGDVPRPGAMLCIQGSGIRSPAHGHVSPPVCCPEKNPSTTRHPQ